MNAWDAARGTATWLALTLLLAFLAGAVLPGGIVWGSVALGAAALAAGAVQVAREGVPPGGRLTALGVTGGSSALRQGVGGLVFGTLMAGAAVSVIALAGGLRWVISAAPPVDWLTGALWALAWLALPAAAEEVLVRGYPLRAATSVVGPGAAVWITAAAFTILHANNPGLGVWGLGTLLGAGLVLGALVVRTGSLWWAVGAHLGWNWALAWGADVPLSGLEVADAPGVEAVQLGPGWLSGGAFGVEGSALATAILLLSALVVWRTDLLSRTNPDGPGSRAYQTTDSMEDDR